MKFFMRFARLSLSFVCLALLPQRSLAGELAVITTHPQTQTVTPGTSVTFTVVASGATSYQWRFNGTNIAGATASAFQIGSAQSADVGYYMVVVKNAFGWVPSRLAYFAVVGTMGEVPLSNQSSGARAEYPSGLMGLYGPINNGSIYVVAGPALDQMKPVGAAVAVNNGYYNGGTQLVPTVEPGQKVYYRVEITYPYASGTFTQQSTVLQLYAGGSFFPKPSTANLKFPGWPEFPEPRYLDDASSPANLALAPDTNVTLTNYFVGYQDYGIPTLQWRKDGRAITAPMNFTGTDFSLTSETVVLSLPNLRPEDAGTYDAVVLGNSWRTGPPIALSVQFTNGPGVLRSPRFSGTNFVCDLEGVPSLNYGIQRSSDLVHWIDLCTVRNASGLVTFTNFAPTPGLQFFRSILLQ